MAQVIQIKRSSSSAAPSSSLAAGELAYSGAGASHKLFIGHPDGSTGNIVIGGKVYVDMLDHTAGTLTASSAILVDSNSKIDVLNVDNLTLNGNSITSTDTNGNILITPNGNGAIILDGFQFPRNGDGSTGQFLKKNSSGELEFAAVSTNFTLSADSGSDDTFATGGTLTFAGTSNEIETTVSNDQIQIGIVSNPTLTGNVTVTGNLTVQGTTTTINSETLTIDDNIIVLNNNASGSPTANAGIEIERGSATNVALRWNETSDLWQLTVDGSNYQDILTDGNFDAQVTTINGGTF